VLVEELEELDPQPAIRRQARTAAALAYPRIDLKVAVPIFMPSVVVVEIRLETKDAPGDESFPQPQVGTAV
jgi:hypothetical protein